MSYHPSAHNVVDFPRDLTPSDRAQMSASFTTATRCASSMSRHGGTSAPLWCLHRQTRRRQEPESLAPSPSIVLTARRCFGLCQRPCTKSVLPVGWLASAGGWGFSRRPRYSYAHHPADTTNRLRARAQVSRPQLSLVGVSANVRLQHVATGAWVHVQELVDVIDVTSSQAGSAAAGEATSAAVRRVRRRHRRWFMRARADVADDALAAQVAMLRGCSSCYLQPQPTSTSFRCPEPTTLPSKKWTVPTHSSWRWRRPPRR